MIVRFTRGLRAFAGGIGYVNRNGLWGYAIAPMLLSLLAAAGLIALIYWAFVYAAGPELESARRDALAYLGRTPGDGGWFETLVQILAAFLALAAAFLLYRAISAVLVLPFLGPLLEAIERLELGAARPTTFREDVRNALLGGWIGLKYAVFGGLVLLFTLPLGPLQIIINTLLQSYFAGRGVFDLLFEKDCANLAERKVRAKTWRAEILGLGLGYFLFLLIPFIGVIFAPIAGLAGAARLYYAANRQIK